MITAGHPLQLNRRGEGIRLHLAAFAEAVALALNHQSGGRDRLQMRRAQLLGLPRRMEGIAKADATAHVGALRQLIRQQAGDAPAHRFATDQQRRSAGRRQRLLAECLLEPGQTIRRRATPGETPFRHVREFKAQHLPTALGQFAGDRCHEGAVHRCAGAVGQQQPQRCVVRAIHQHWRVVRHGVFNPRRCRRTAPKAHARRPR